MPKDSIEPIDWGRLRTPKKKSLQQLIFESHALSEKLASTAKQHSDEGMRLSKRFQKALAAAGHNHLASQIRSCGENRRCGSTYCSGCRSRLGVALRKRTDRNIVKRFGGKPERILANVHHVTGHIDVASIDAGQIRQSIAGERAFFATLVESRPWLRIEGAFELELLHFGHMDKMGREYSPEKKKQIESMLKGTLTRAMYGDDEMVVYVHWHALIAGLDDIKDRGYFSKEVEPSARVLLEDRYSGHRHLHVQPLYPVSRKAIGASIAAISSYPFKDAHRLKYSFEGATNAYGEYVDPVTLGNFIKVYRDVGSNRNGGLAISHRQKREAREAEVQHRLPNAIDFMEDAASAGSVPSDIRTQLANAAASAQTTTSVVRGN